MKDPAKKLEKKGFVTEEDMSCILRRYPATTVLTLLQEVAQSPNGKIDWKLLAAKTNTKITNAREYQMLWRHLAYGHSLLEKIDGEEPLDDDSDLEYEVEAFPAVSAEASAEAAACVKVLIASGLANEAGMPSNSTVEAPLTINVPSGHPSKCSVDNSNASSSLQGTNITIPVSVQKQSPFSGQKYQLPIATSSEAIGANTLAGGGFPPRKKRKPWSEEEDMELIAAVQKCGEGNWANILKGDFTGDRSASQLSQRWSIIRKKKTNLSVVGSTQVQVNTNAALRAAFEGSSKQPSVNNNHATVNILKEELSESQSQPLTSNNSQSRRNVPEVKHELNQSAENIAQPQSRPGQDANNCNEHSQNQSHQIQSRRHPHQATSAVTPGQHQPLQGPTKISQAHQSGNSDQSEQGITPTSSTAKALHHSTGKPLSKPRHVMKKAPVKSTISSDSLVKAAAVAAGARIASPSEATLFKAAQAKNAVHIISSAGSSANTPATGVHYIRATMPATSPPVTVGTSCQITGTQQLKGNDKPCAQNVSLPQSSKATKPSLLSERPSISADKKVNEHQQKQDGKAINSVPSDGTLLPGTLEGPESVSGHLPTEQLVKDSSSLSEESIVTNQNAVENDQRSQNNGISVKSTEGFCTKDVEMRDADAEESINEKPDDQSNLLEAPNKKLEESGKVDRVEAMEQET